VPRAPWRRRRSTDSPRPAGRRWARRLRRSGSLARQVLLVGRPGRRRAESTTSATTLILPENADLDVRRPGPVRLRRRAGTAATAPPVAAPAVVPIESPALAPVTPAAAGGLAVPLLPGDPTLGRRIRFVAVNACTVGSLLLGLSAIFLALNHVSVRWAAVCLIACVAFDGIDGALARKLGVASPFGAQMDSLADLSSFGVATGIVVFEWLVAGGASPLLAGPACALIAVCAAIRLARFNVSPKDGRYFCGVPTTMLAAVLALDILVGPHLPAGAQVLAITVYALAMVSSFPYAKLVRVLRLPLWVWALPAICAMISVPGTYAVIVGGYLISGPVLWLFHRQRHPLPA
jgi:CDP-diacylglycerol---serine O-phosphatidyltransferase